MKDMDDQETALLAEECEIDSIIGSKSGIVLVEFPEENRLWLEFIGENGERAIHKLLSNEKERYVEMFKSRGLSLKIWLAST